jgi:hypothetical protein
MRLVTEIAFRDGAELDHTPSSMAKLLVTSYQNLALSQCNKLCLLSADILCLFRHNQLRYNNEGGSIEMSHYLASHQHNAETTLQ